MKITVEFDSMEELEAFRARREPAPAKTKVNGSALSVRAQNLLLAAGLEHIEDAQAQGKWELLKLPNLGRTTADEVMTYKTGAT